MPEDGFIAVFRLLQFKKFNPTFKHRQQLLKLFKDECRIKHLVRDALPENILKKKE